MSSLPIEHVLPELLDTVRQNRNTVLSAPPGAGKTTRVPLALLEIIPATCGRIVMLEPRRIAAASAAMYMAGSLGEETGQTVGYTIRFESRVSKYTRIEVVTEGILTRRIQNDPELSDVACVIFDEFHERSIHSDLALALCLESQSALRPDLKILVMSATLDCNPVAALLGDAPVISSEGMNFPVDVRYSPPDATLPLFRQMAQAVRTAIVETEGDILAFLPGSGEIRSVERELQGISSAVVCPLYGDMPFEQQQQAILPGRERRVVLATNIAETSLTIDGVRVVIDSGVARRIQLDPATGLERLVTVRTSKAAARQRAGRGGRTAPGVCYRLYHEQTFSAMTPFTPAEILAADLSPLLLELAAWGVTDPASLAWLDEPPVLHLAAARDLLRMLGAIDCSGAITETGRRMVQMPLHPRLSRMMVAASDIGEADAACRFAAELSSRSAPQNVVSRTYRQLRKLFDLKESDGSNLLSPETIAVAWPDRIAGLRQKGEGRYLLSSGRGAVLTARADCNGAEFLVALEVDGGEGSDGIIHRAFPLSVESIRRSLSTLVTTCRVVEWDDAQGRVVASEQERIGSLQLLSRHSSATDEEAVPILLQQLVRRGMPLPGWDEGAVQLVARVRLASSLLPEAQWPDLSDQWLINNLDAWLSPHLAGCRSVRSIEGLEMTAILKGVIGWSRIPELDEIAPVQIEIPSGRMARLDYSSEDGPLLSVKLQEMFGLADSPVVCRGRRAVLVHLLSPAGRPVAVTRDLKGFWARGYQDVRKELRGRYPKHPWPEDPWNFKASGLTKRRLERASA